MVAIASHHQRHHALKWKCSKNDQYSRKTAFHRTWDFNCTQGEKRHVWNLATPSNKNSALERDIKENFHFSVWEIISLKSSLPWTNTHPTCTRSNLISWLMYCYISNYEMPSSGPTVLNCEHDITITLVSTVFKCNCNYFIFILHVIDKISFKKEINCITIASFIQTNIFLFLLGRAKHHGSAKFCLLWVHQFTRSKNAENLWMNRWNVSIQNLLSGNAIVICYWKISITSTEIQLIPITWTEMYSITTILKQNWNYTYVYHSISFYR